MIDAKTVKEILDILLKYDPDIIMDILQPYVDESKLVFYNKSLGPLKLKLSHEDSEKLLLMNLELDKMELWLH